MSAEDLRSAILVVHGVAAVVALVSGVLVLRDARGRTVHLVALAIMAVALGPSMALGWEDFPAGARVAFVGLAVLSVHMTFVAARVMRTGAGSPLTTRVVDLVGFNVISLVVAGTIVPLLRLDLAVWQTVVVVLLCFGVTRTAVQRRRLTVERRSTADVAAPRLHLKDSRPPAHLRADVRQPHASPQDGPASPPSS